MAIEAAAGVGLQLAADTRNNLFGRIADRDHVTGMVRSMQNVQPENVAFGRNDDSFRPAERIRPLTGDRLVLKEDALSYMRSDKSLSDSKRLGGALGGDRCGWTQTTCTTILPYIMPKLRGEVLSLTVWAKLYLQLEWAALTASEELWVLGIHHGSTEHLRWLMQPCASKSECQQPRHG